MTYGASGESGSLGAALAASIIEIVCVVVCECEFYPHRYTLRSTYMYLSVFEIQERRERRKWR